MAEPNWLDVAGLVPANRISSESTRRLIGRLLFSRPFLMPNSGENKEKWACSAKDDNS